MSVIHRAVRALACAAALVLAAVCPGQARDRDPALLIDGGSVIDPAGDAPAVRADVLIVGGRIRQVARDIRPPRGARVIDATGRYLTPGLWDMHAHLAATKAPAREIEGYVGHGVLGVRDMGGKLDLLRALKAEIAAGRPGPLLVVAGPTLNGESFGDFQRAVTTEAEGRAAVRDLKRQGVDLIKVHRATKPAVLRAILDEARRVGLKVGGHVPLGMRWSEAVEAGVYSIEHVQTLIENEITDPRSIPQIQEAVVRLEGAYGDDLWAAMARRGVYWDPTIIFYEKSIEGAPAPLAAQRRMLLDRLAPLVGRAARAGVPIVTGTDAIDHPAPLLWDELDRLVKAGLTPRQAFRAATSTAARAAGRPELGRIARGAPASLLIFEADPSADPANVRRLNAVVLRGRLMETADLERLRALDR